MRRDWIAGLVVGGAGGLAALEIPPIGWAVLLAFVVPASLASRPFAAVGGLFCGLGVSWLGLLGRLGLTCRPPDCLAPGLEPWLAIAVVATVLGVVLTVVAVLRSARGRR